MAAGTYDRATQAGILLEGFLSLGMPEGFRAELIEGEIVVRPLPDGDHEDCVNVVLKQVLRKSRTDMDFSGNKGLELPTSEGRPSNHAVPDGTFAPTGLRIFRGADLWMPCEGVALVVEVTSTKPQADREAKRRCYARGGIPLYLLIDRDDSSVTLFSDPENDDYRQILTIPYGKPLPLPEPFAFDLETGDFG
ncbi:Uma2 family endonuclease [Streptomyces sp. WAC00303]|uniref:Uma2 family endonuclease n=1 Tax=Streptomyces sp. WAC00303 TaxID=2933779 RepID=UPI00206CC412|nr:Uma2 family endonuclease [Streptomyces sp. WAC00303]UPT41592.1 Uma2 family endonuclease [Streptomyces sp. WAC00303]